MTDRRVNGDLALWTYLDSVREDKHAMEYISLPRLLTAQANKRRRPASGSHKARRCVIDEDTSRDTGSRASAGKSSCRHPSLPPFPTNRHSIVFRNNEHGEAIAGTELRYPNSFRGTQRRERNRRLGGGSFLSAGTQDPPEAARRGGDTINTRVLSDTAIPSVVTGLVTLVPWDVLPPDNMVSGVVVEGRMADTMSSKWANTRDKDQRYESGVNAASLLREVEEMVGSGPPHVNGQDTDEVMGNDFDASVVKIPIGQLTGTDMEAAPEPTAMPSQRRTSRDRRTPKSDTCEPGVSNTTQLLIQRQLRRTTFQFPEVSLSEQRKALGTPRYDDSLASSRSLRCGVSRQGNKRFPALERSNTDLDLDQLDTPRSNPRMSDKLESRSSLGSVNTKSKNNKFISLGLPRVTLDIDRSHLAHHGMKRRSLRSRDYLPTTDHYKNPPPSSGANSSTAKDPKQVIVNISVENGKDPDHFENEWPGRMPKRQLSSPYEDLSGDKPRGPSGSSSCSSGTPSRGPSPNPRTPRRPQSNNSKADTTSSVSYSCYQMHPPPGPNKSEEMSGEFDALTPKYRYVPGSNASS